MTAHSGNVDSGNVDPGADHRCNVEGCDRPAWCRGWCTAHYFRWRSTGDVRADEPISRTKQPPTCTIEGCGRKTYARGLCEKHYRRWQRNGEVTPDRPTAGAQPCAVDDCDEPAITRGWCHGHYQRWLRTGDVQPDVVLDRRRQPEVCTVEGCSRPANAKGYCRAHLERIKQHGDPLARVPIAEYDGKGSLSHGYWKVPVPPELLHLTNGETSVGEHRLVMARHLGRALLPEEVVHHRDGDRLNNAIENLELWSTAHPKGQREEDKVAWALQILRLYAPHLLVPEAGEATP